MPALLLEPNIEILRYVLFVNVKEINTARTCQSQESLQIKYLEYKKKLQFCWAQPKFSCIKVVLFHLKNYTVFPIQELCAFLLHIYHGH